MYTVHIHMKSGKTIVVDDVLEFSVETTGNAVSTLELKRKNKTVGYGLLIGSITLSQIEAVEAFIVPAKFFSWENVLRVFGRK